MKKFRCHDSSDSWLSTTAPVENDLLGRRKALLMTIATFPILPSCDMARHQASLGDRMFYDFTNVTMHSHLRSQLHIAHEVTGQRE